VGIADGFGVAEDPKGLDREELLRLVHESLPITSFKKVNTSTFACACTCRLALTYADYLEMFNT
jgi:hypothetical protein